MYIHGFHLHVTPVSLHVHTWISHVAPLCHYMPIHGFHSHVTVCTYIMYSASGRAGTRNYIPVVMADVVERIVIWETASQFFLQLKILQCGRNNVKSSRWWNVSKSGWIGVCAVPMPMPTLSICYIGAWMVLHRVN